ncbi:MAG: hypothetical protein EOL97_09740 [Spirochaetia bacterium]|nr:hypothetical protein [Spirochaetia bacterium]
MIIEVKGNYEVQTDNDCFEKHYGLCKFYVTDEQCLTAIKYELLEKYLKQQKEDYTEKFLKENRKATRHELSQVIEWVLEKIDMDYEEFEDCIKNYYTDNTEDLEIEDVVEEEFD